MVNLGGPQVSYWLVCTPLTLVTYLLPGLRIVTSDSNSPRSAIESARRTIAIERQAVEQLEQRIDDSFSSAVNLLASVEEELLSAEWERVGISAIKLLRRSPVPVRLRNSCIQPKPATAIWV